MWIVYFVPCIPLLPSVLTPSTSLVSLGESVVTQIPVSITQGENVSSIYSRLELNTNVMNMKGCLSQPWKSDYVSRNPGNTMKGKPSPGRGWKYFHKI